MQRQIAHSLPTIDDHNLKIENQEKGKKKKKKEGTTRPQGLLSDIFFGPNIPGVHII